VTGVSVKAVLTVSLTDGTVHDRRDLGAAQAIGFDGPDILLSTIRDSVVVDEGDVTYAHDLARLNPATGTARIVCRVALTHDLLLRGSRTAG
jgi:hypothetical protein